MNARVGFVGVVSLGVALSGVALAAETVLKPLLAVKTTNDFVRVTVTWPETMADAPPTTTAKVANGVAVITFSRAISTDVAKLPLQAPGLIKTARLDPDGKTLRLGLKQSVSPALSRSFNVQAIDFIAPAAKAMPPLVDSPRGVIERAKAAEKARLAAEEAERLKIPPPPFPVTVGVADSFTRLVFEWPGKVTHTFTPGTGKAEIVFHGRGRADLAPVRVDLPARLKNIEQVVEPRQLTVRMTLAEGNVATSFQDGAFTVIDIAAKPTATTPAADPKKPAEPTKSAIATPPVVIDLPPEAPVEPSSALPKSALLPGAAPIYLSNAAPVSADGTPLERRNPIPPTGIVPVEVTGSGETIALDVNFSAPAPAAIFARDNSVFLVFPQGATYDIGDQSTGNFTVAPLKGAGVSGMVITSAKTPFISAQPIGSRWFVRIATARGATPPVDPIRFAAMGGKGAVAIAAAVPGAQSVGMVNDPNVGDKIAVGLSYAPAAAVLQPRRFIEATALPTAQGIAFSRLADEVKLEIDTGLFKLMRPGGLIVSRSALDAAAPPVPTALDAPPGFIDFGKWRVETGAVLAGASALTKAASIDGVGAAPARLALARYLVANELAAEALGALELAADADPPLEETSPFRAVRGAASYMMGRMKDAERDLMHPSLAADPSAALWRGLTRVAREDWEGAVADLEAGASALPLYTPEWRARFRAAAARARIELGDIQGARALVDAAHAEKPDGIVLDEVKMVEAAVREAQDRKSDALTLYAAIKGSQSEMLAARAAFEHARLSYEMKAVTPDEAIDAFESVRWQWRGDDLELEAARRIGGVHMSQGRLSAGIDLMRIASARRPDRPPARRMFDDMHNAFRTLFLDGAADKLDPIEAMGLFYEFREFAPLGEDGDRMIRRLSDRLVQFDLLPQAARLLKHQVEKRLEGLPKAEVAAELASIELMDGRPEDALRTLRTTRVARLPTGLAHERRLLEAAALARLKRPDLAIELIEDDETPEGQRLKADVLWAARDWAKSAKAHDALLPSPDAAKISPVDEESLLRAAVSYSRANDSAALKSLRAKYGTAMAKLASGPIFDLVTDGEQLDVTALSELSLKLASSRNFETFLREMRKKTAIRARNSLENGEVAAPGSLKPVATG